MRTQLQLNKQIVIVPEDSDYKGKESELVYKTRTVACSQCGYLKMQPCWCESEGRTFEDMMDEPLVCGVCRGTITAEQEKERIKKKIDLPYEGWEMAYLPSND